jgi:hypothetical protein
MAHALWLGPARAPPRRPLVAEPKLVELLRADACCHCDGPMAWPNPLGITFANRTAAPHACHARAEIEHHRTRSEAATPHQEGPF